MLLAPQECVHAVGESERIGILDISVQGVEGNRVCRRKATTTASSSIVSEVDLGSLRPVGRPTVDLRFFHLAMVF